MDHNVGLSLLSSYKEDLANSVVSVGITISILRFRKENGCYMKNGFYSWLIQLKVTSGQR